MNFSVAVIARNEAKTLPRLLASLGEFRERGGKMVVLDTGSTDATVEVARAGGCQVVAVGDRFVRHFDAELADAINTRFAVDDEGPIIRPGDRVFDYASARNYVAQLSPTDMIAMPDCDEVYTQLALDEVCRQIDAGAEQLSYNFVFAHDAAGKPLREFTHSKFYNRLKLEWVGVIHEVLQGSAQCVTLPESTIKLEHFQNKETDRSGYLRGLALDCYLHPENPRNSHYFGRELYYTGKWKSSIKELERHIAMNEWLTERAQSMVYIGDNSMRLGRDEEGLEWYFKSIRTEPRRREPLLRLAEYYFGKNEPQLTAIFASAALEIDKISFYSNDAAHYGAYPHELLYWAKWRLGDQAGSRNHFAKALALDPTNPRVLRDKVFFDNA